MREKDIELEYRKGYKSFIYSTIFYGHHNISDNSDLNIETGDCKSALQA